MIDFSKKSETIAYFNSIISELKESKIKTIFSLSDPHWSSHKGYPIYNSETEFYILLENGKCLVIDYLFIDLLNVQFRKLTKQEMDEYETLLTKDCFNRISNLYDYNYKIKRVDSCTFEYGCITSINLRSVTKKYNKWINGQIDYVLPTEETFSVIDFTMSNGNSFAICADDAEVDGYVLLWSEDAIETFKFPPFEF